MLREKYDPNFHIVIKAGHNMKHYPDNCPNKPENLRKFKSIKKNNKIAKFCEDCDGEIPFLVNVVITPNNISKKYSKSLLK